LPGTLQSHGKDVGMAAQPPVPVRGYSFTDWQVANPTAPPPGDRLDAEYDRADGSISQTIDWVATSLKTDGTIRDGIIGQNQLVSGLFEDVAQGIIDEVQPMVDSAAGSAASALGSAGEADASAGEAETANVAAQNARALAESARNGADLAKVDAQTSAAIAETRATDAQNAANHAAGDAALAEDWGVVSEAWAEHMPDPIPPNILAVMGITGNHWSSRWWANKALQAFGGTAFIELYLGAWPVPPTTTSTGEPIPVGALYYNTTNNQTYVWNGTQWMPIVQPAVGSVASLAYAATAGQTHFDTSVGDIAGATHPMTGDTTLDVHVNGVRVLLDVPAGAGDYTVDKPTSSIVFNRPLLAGSIVQIDVVSTITVVAGIVVVVSLLDFDVDPVTGDPGQIDGTRTTFPLALASDHSPVSVTRSSDISVVLDGVPQQPDHDYAALDTDITFSEAPLVGARAWAVWYSPIPLPARLILTDMPMADPHVAGQLWNRDGAVMISAGGGP